VNAVAATSEVGWGAVGDDCDNEAKWVRADDTSQPRWADGVVEAVVARRQRSESSRYGREWGNVLDNAQELERPEASCLDQSTGLVSKRPSGPTLGCNKL
jgi:hypothetical protein